jgi:hypothetical protein
MTDKKKIKEYKNLVINWLSNNKCDSNHTHASYGPLLTGKFKLEKENLTEFMRLYNQAIINDVKDLTILEVQPEYGPIIIDIDLKKPSDECLPNGRLYDTNLIMIIIKKYLSVIEKYIKIDKDNFNIATFEKDRATDLNDIYKDGFHIIMPDIILAPAERHKIRHEVVQSCIEDNIFESYIESADKIVDKAVVVSNGWLLYGSKKPDGYNYELKYIYNYNLNCIYDYLNPDLPIDKIINYFSLQFNPKKYRKKNANRLLDITHSDIIEEVNNLGINISSKSLMDIIYENSSDAEKINNATKYCALISPFRANNYEDWRNIGLALHNTHESLLSVFKNFSEKCPEKYFKTDQGNCEKFWKSFKIPTNGSCLTIRTLAYYAKIDNPKEFDLYNNNNFNTKILQCTDDTHTVSNLFHIKYRDIFKYCKGKWYQWTDKKHRWIGMEEAYILMKLIPTEFANEFYKVIGDLNHKITKINNSSDKETLENKIKNLNKIISKIKNISYRKQIIEEASALFMDENYEDNIDSNVFFYLFCIVAYLYAS